MAQEIADKNAAVAGDSLDALHQKKQHLENYLRELGSIAVAFSSGVDSTFLLSVAHEVLGDKVLAVTARSHSFPQRELNEAIAFCKEHGIAHEVLDSEELNIEGFRQNPKNRCYLCKHELFSEIRDLAAVRGLAAVVEGSNMDDNGDYRPGLQAVAELGIKSPLREAQLYKQEIRNLSREMGLATWNKQSFACLSSRFVYGETISEQKLDMVDKAEQRLLDLGLHQVRVRIHGSVHGTIARIEVEPAEFSRVMEHAAELDKYLRGLGFTYVTLDLGGYKMGSMNRTI